MTSPWAVICKQRQNWQCHSWVRLSSVKWNSTIESFMIQSCSKSTSIVSSWSIDFFYILGKFCLGQVLRLISDGMSWNLSEQSMCRTSMRIWKSEDSISQSIPFRLSQTWNFLQSGTSTTSLSSDRPKLLPSYMVRLAYRCWIWQVKRA